ncbi:hypothetical protein D3C79_691290 [compost metagenome]
MGGDVDVRFGQAGLWVPLADVENTGGYEVGGRGVGVIANALDTQHQVMAATEQLEWPVEGGAQVVLQALAAVALGNLIVHQVGVVAGVGSAAGAGEVGLLETVVIQLEVRALGHQLEGPVIVEMVFELGKGLQVAAVPAVPVGTQVSAAAKRQGRAIIVGGQVAPGAGGIELGPLKACGQGGAFIQIEGQHTVEHLFALLARVLEMVLVIVHGDHPASHVAGFCQRAGDIGDITLGIPGAEGDAAFALEFVRRAFAHQVHGA